MNALYDLCFTPKPEWDALLCGLLNDFAESCDNVGFKINRWRNDTFCPYVCPVDNMVHNYDSTTCMNTTSNCGETINSENCSPVERCECPESAPIWDVENKVCVNQCPGVCNVEWDRDWCDANFHTADIEQLCCCGVQTCCEPDKCVHRTTTPGPTTTQATTTQATTVREILKKVGGMTEKPKIIKIPKIIKNTQHNKKTGSRITSKPFFTRFTKTAIQPRCIQPQATTEAVCSPDWDSAWCNANYLQASVEQLCCCGSASSCAILELPCIDDIDDDGDQDCLNCHDNEEDETTLAALPVATTTPVETTPSSTMEPLIEETTEAVQTQPFFDDLDDNVDPEVAATTSTSVEATTNSTTTVETVTADTQPFFENLN